jgi:Domain of unknown function (DUF4145)
MSKFNWQCPFCGHDAVVHSGQEGTVSNFRHEFHHGNKHGVQSVIGQVVVCPNADCQEYTLHLTTFDRTLWQGTMKDTRQRAIWRLVPESEAKVFPDYIPKPILDDYREACVIRDKSPRASATLSRRCLQGMIRDFWGVRMNRLVDEIDAIRERVDPETWDAIDAVRKIGNIGAHMEKDINIIVDVDTNEAQLLIELVETLLTEWHVAKNERQKRMAAVKNAAALKKPAQPNGAALSQTPAEKT